MAIAERTWQQTRRIGIKQELRAYILRHNRKCHTSCQNAIPSDPPQTVPPTGKQIFKDYEPGGGGSLEPPQLCVYVCVFELLD